MSSNDNENITETTNNEHPYFKIVTDNENDNVKVLVLHEAYRGVGDEYYPFSERGAEATELELPEVLEIPEKIGEESYQSLAKGMFYGNKHIKEIVLPTGVETIPEAFCCRAANLRSVHKADGSLNDITHIGGAAFTGTRLKEARFPDLTDLVLKAVPDEETGITNYYGGAFAGCAYLEAVDIGTVTSIPERTFFGCARLREVSCDGTGISIGLRAFAQTRSLTELSWLEKATSVEKGAFFYSRITEYTLPEDDDPDQARFPTSDNGSKIFWEDVEYTPCENRIVTKLSQKNADWTEKTFLTNYGVKYTDGCALFAVMHIHSAITGKRYSHPDEFMEELRNDPKLSRFQYYGNWPGQFKNVAAMFEALGYRTEVHGNGSELSKENFQALLDALAQGAYVFSQVHTYEKWTDTNTEEDYDGGHAVVLYGVNELGEVRVLDSNVLYEGFREEGFEPDIDVYTYTMPYQNMVGATSDFVIVYPPETETDAE